MHILFLTDNFPPEVNAPASRTFEHCREWVRQPECAVTVITCAPNFPKGKVYEGYTNKFLDVEWIDGIRVIRVWSYVAPNEGTFKRTLDYLSFMVMATVASAMVRRVDIIVATSPQFFTACAGYLVSILKRRPWVFELRDIWPESVRAVGAITNRWALHTLERLELFLYRKANLVVAVTEAFGESLRQRGVDPRKINVVTNGVDISRFSPVAKDKELLLKLGLKGEFIAGYIGTHGLAHGLDTILDAASILMKSHRNRNIQFLLVGDGAEKEKLKSKANQLKLTNVLFLDSVARDEIPRYWSILDASIIHLKRDQLFETVIPSKIFESMAMGIPILHGVRGESSEIISSSNSGILFEAENADSLVEALLHLASNPKERKKISASCLVAGNRYDRSALAKKMMAALRQI